MATKYQIELALKAVLLELKHLNLDLHTIRDNAILRMHQKNLSVKEGAIAEKEGAEDKLFELVLQIAGDDPRAAGKKSSIEEF
uniref:hypothetical protein n=1 Tax=Rahnella sp. RFA10(1/100) TaxID=2511202 RepID=UPI0010202A64|nr:hypothetical protein [Rahnella sp. RFA10(1/100)]